MLNPSSKQDSNLAIDVALGNIPGVYSVNKFGASINGVQTTLTDIWDRANSAALQQIWVAPTAARVHTITSSSTSDTSGGSGARTIRVYGLTSWNTKETYEDVTMNGTVGQATVNSYVIIHRMRVLTSGNSGPNVGNIDATAATDSTVTARIQIADGQTLMCIYGIPSGQTLLMSNFAFNCHDNTTPNTAAEIDFKIVACETPDVNPAIFITKHTGGLVTLGSGNYQHFFSPYKSFPGPAIIKMQAIGSSEDLYVTGNFDGYLKDV
jgi:hypothetical protein